MYEFTPELKGRTIFFVKFSNNKTHLETLQKGTLYLNTLEFYNELENQLKKKGMGDGFEARDVWSNLELNLYDNKTNNLVLSGKARQAMFWSKEDSEKHVLCLSHIDYSNLEIYEESRDSFKANIVFSDIEKEQIKENFGEYALIISAYAFINNLDNNLKKSRVDYIAGKVKYSDYSINNTERIESYINNKPDKYLWKDSFFSDQKEYRVVVINRDSADHIEMQIDDMTSFSFLTTVDELFNNGYTVESHFDPEKDLIEL